VSTICIDPRSDLLWQRLLGRHASSVFHSPEWMQVLTETYGWPISAYLLLDAAGEPMAGIPFCRVNDVVGERIVSLPFSDHCDPLVADTDQWIHLSASLIGERCPIVMRCLHNSLPRRDERLTLVKQTKWHGLELQPPLGCLWDGLDESTRRAIRKARRDGVVVRPAESTTELRAFFDLHLGIRKHKYHLLAQPYCFFQNIWRHFIAGGRGALLIAIYNREIIGGIFFLEWKGVLYYKFNASNPTHLAHRPNDLLVWEGIQYGKAKDYTYLDFGLSDWDQEGLVRYKRKFATDEKAIAFLRYAPEEVPSQHEWQVRDLLPQLTDLFTDASVPDSITDKAGEVLYRYFA
jgi:CelD/BcsL family acetyltransferase involved in cellulose biosynthesis